MNGHPTAPRPASLVGIFITIFLSVFVVIVLTSTLVTFIQPESFVSEARLKLSPTTLSADLKPAANPYDPTLAATEVQTILSEDVLIRVIAKEQLNTEWGRRYASGEKLKTTESYGILRSRLDVRPLPNTTCISIRVYSEDRAEAARLANTVALAYMEATPKLSPFITVQMIDSARPAMRPIRPNKPLNIILGMVVGTLLAGACAAAVTGLTAGFRAKRRQAAPPPDGGLKPIY